MELLIRSAATGDEAEIKEMLKRAPGVWQAGWREAAARAVRGRPSNLIGIPNDRPVIGYGDKTINTLRLWAAGTPDYLDFAQFSSGDFVGALAETLTAETLDRVLYPDDTTIAGKGLRFLQEYFLVACSLADLVHRFREAGNDRSALFAPYPLRFKLIFAWRKSYGSQNKNGLPVQSESA